MILDPDISCQPLANLRLPYHLVHSTAGLSGPQQEIHSAYLYQIAKSMCKLSNIHFLASREEKAIEFCLHHELISVSANELLVDGGGWPCPQKDICFNQIQLV